jgi:hypothetical protein
MAGNVVDLVADKDLQGETAFEATFPPTVVGELSVECDPKKSGPPVCVLSDGAAGKAEIHPMPVRGREGRYMSHVKETTAFTSIRVTIARNMKAHLVKVRLIARVEHAAPAPAPTPAPKPARSAKPPEAPKPPAPPK